jgi:hypothetical protein
VKLIRIFFVILLLLVGVTASQTAEVRKGPLFFEANERLLKNDKRLENVEALVKAKRQLGVVYAGNSAVSGFSNVIRKGTCGKSWFSGDGMVKMQRDLASNLLWLGPKGIPDTDYAYVVKFCLNFESFEFENSCKSAKLNYKYFLVYERFIKNAESSAPNDNSCKDFKPQANGTSVVLFSKQKTATGQYTSADNASQLETESERALGSLYGMLMQIASDISTDADIAKSIYEHSEILPTKSLPVQPVSSPEDTLQGIKKQCNELGFAEGTEGQNQCVLRLLK